MHYTVNVLKFTVKIASFVVENVINFTCVDSTDTQLNISCYGRDTLQSSIAVIE